MRSFHRVKVFAYVHHAELRALSVPLVYGVILSVVVGGAVGLARMFFEAGSAAFGTNW